MLLVYRIIGAVVGGAIGFAAYKFIGCSTGACPITSNPYVSVIIGALLVATVPAGCRLRRRTKASLRERRGSRGRRLITGYASPPDSCTGARVLPAVTFRYWNKTRRQR
jgi:hypothetical protein